MKLAIVTDKRFETDGERCVSQGGFGRSVEIWSRYFAKIFLCVPVYSVDKAIGYTIGSGKFDIAALPAPQSRMQELWMLWRTWRRLLDPIANCDLLQIRAGSIVAALGLLAGRRKRKPLFILIQGDYLAVRRAQKKFLSLFPYGPVTWGVEMFTRRLTRDQMCFATGDALRVVYQRYSAHVYTMPDTTIYERDLSQPRPKCAGQQVRLLYVGRLSPEKGVQFLLKALPQSAHFERLSLDIVGAGPEETALSAQVRASALEPKVALHGFISHGEALRRFYDAADVLVVPSLSEGWPKVILEAHARCVPVIATDVGGIPSLVEDGRSGLLVPSASPGHIAQAIDRLIRDPELRQRLVERGLAIARQYTAEAIAQQQVELLNLHFGLDISPAGQDAGSHSARTASTHG